MKNSLISIIFIAFAIPAAAQWRNAGFHGPDGNVLAMATHDSNFFIADSVVLGAQHLLYRFVNFASNQEINWTDADSGMSPRSDVRFFASLGPYFYADTRVYSSRDEGQSWTPLMAGGPFGSNGRYLFGQVYLHPTVLLRSGDSGATWDSLRYIKAAGEFTAMGSIMFANVVDTGSSVYQLWRTEDNGNTWTKLSSPFTGKMTVLDSSLFIVANGQLAESTDLGSDWSIVPVDSAGVPAFVNVLATDGRNLFAGTNKGILVSTDIGTHWTPKNEGILDFENLFPYKNLPFTITALGVFDTLLFADISFWRADNPLAPPYEYFLAYRPISEMIGSSSVSQSHLPSDTIEVYPNPASGMVSIFSGGTTILGLRVLNVLGEGVLSIEYRAPSAGELQLDLSKLPSGTYFLLLQTSTGTVLRKITLER